MGASLNVDRTYYFLHIPKTAGTSLRTWIEEGGKHSLFPGGLWSQLLAAERAELDRYSFFFGHFYRNFYQYIERPVETLTFLRNPFDRTLSHYNHICRDRNHYFHGLVQEQGSFLEFLMDPTTRSLVENCQVRSLAVVLDPELLLRRMGSGSHRFALEQYIETVMPKMGGDVMLAVAKDLLLRSRFVGIADRMDESIQRLAAILGISPDLKVRRLNVAAAGVRIEDLSGCELDELAKVTRLDWDLYEFALNLFRVS